MVKSRNTKAKKLQSERNRFILIFTFCCGHCEFEDKGFFDEVLHENDVYKPTCSEIIGSAEKEQKDLYLRRLKDDDVNYRPGELFSNTQLDTSPCTSEICDTPTLNTVVDYPDDLNPFSEDDEEQIGVSEQECLQEMRPKRHSIDDYPEELNPFAEDIDEAE